MHLPFLKNNNLYKYDYILLDNEKLGCIKGSRNNKQLYRTRFSSTDLFVEYGKKYVLFNALHRMSIDFGIAHRDMFNKTFYEPIHPNFVIMIEILSNTKSDSKFQ